VLSGDYRHVLPCPARQEFLGQLACLWLGPPYQCHRPGSFNENNLCLHRCGGWKSEVDVLQGWFLLRPLTMACRWRQGEVPVSCVLTWSFL
jgi:hypothetical protein